MCNLVSKWSTVKVLDRLYEIARNDTRPKIERGDIDSETTPS